ncbi:uncharacterized protein myo [Drosophila montana]|uniref:uncharacterized protein myo n=1 Tax=Drosophila montana TaxID=40370 RepID=UPI00313D0856
MNTTQFASKNNNTMASLEEATKLTKHQRVHQLAKLYGCSKSIDRLMSIDDSDSDSDFRSSLVNISAKIPFHSACCHCSSKPRRIQMKSRSWRFRFLVARYATIVIFSMVILLASAQEEVNNNKKASRGDDKPLTLNESSRSPLSSSSHTAVPNENTIVSEPEPEPEPETETIPNKGQSRRRTNKGLEMPAGLLSGGGTTQGFSMIRNSLISGDSVLQRQLREKAKQDSLESIKMHILMRLNLKKLPNITKPILVPQTILEKFYKNYNASLSNSLRDHNNKPHSDSDSRTGLYVPEEIVTESSENVTKNIYNSEHTTSANHSSSSQNSSPEMQADDPNNFKEFQFIYNLGFDEHQNVANHKSTDFRTNDDDDHDNDDDDVEYESILSHISSIYIFPEQPHVRHNRKSELLRFKFNTGYSDISHVTLHLYLRGLEWISEHQPKIIEEIANYQNKDIVVALHRAIRRSNSTSYTHKAKIFEFRHKIPSGLGQWVNVDLKPLFGNEYDRMGPNPNQLQEIFIKGVEPWMRPLVVTTDSTSKNPLTVHIEIGSRKKHRRKRSVYLDCIESDHELRCCRYPLKVNFTSFGWHFVVAPDSFDAYFCSGECRVGYLEQYPHTHLAALTTSATPCCSPTKMSSLSLLYFDESHNLVLSVIPNMSVEGCSCS